MERAAPASTLRRASRRYLASAIGGMATLVLSLAVSSWPLSKVALLVAFSTLGFLGFLVPLRRLAASHGPRYTLQAIILAWTLFLVVPMLVGVIRLPNEVYYVDAGFMGAGLAGIYACHRRLRRTYPKGADPQIILFTTAGIAVAVGSVAITGSLAFAFGAFAILMASSVRLLSKVPDPIVVGPSPYAAYLPWRLEDGGRRSLGKGWWARFPAHLTYSFGTAALFATWILVYGSDRTKVPPELTWMFVYEIPNLFQDIPRTLVNFAAGIWFNHHPVQLIYVFALFALFGIWFEIHEGSRRAIIVFYGTSIFAGITAGIVLHAIRALWDAMWIDEAWTHAWNGGSAGAFGLAGGYVARARRPWLLASVLLFWELNVELWHLRSYTVAFHVAALACGYVWVRYGMAPRGSPPNENTDDAAAVRPSVLV